MPRLDAVDSDTATGRTNELADQVHRKLGVVPNREASPHDLLGIPLGAARR